MSDKAIWRHLMSKYVGRYDQGSRCWVDKYKKDSLCIRPHKLERIKLPTGETQVMAVVTGKTTANDNKCHACTGFMKLFDLRLGNGSLKLIAKSLLYEEVGAWGQIPPEESFTARKIGNSQYAWFIETSYGGQGSTYTHTMVYASQGKTISQIGLLPSKYDDLGACGPESYSNPLCSDYRFTIQIMPNSDQYYPIQLLGEGIKDGVPIDSIIEYRYSKEQIKYLTKDPLPSEFEQ